MFLFAAEPISIGLFGHADYVDVVRAVAFIQMGIAYANLFMAVLKGYRDAMGNALAVIGGSLIGVVAYYLCFKLGGYEGALAGLALVPALVVLPAGLMLWRRKTLPLRYLAPRWDKLVAGNLGKFTLMALITSVTLPVAYVMMRNLLAPITAGMRWGFGGASAAFPMPICSLSPLRLPSICCRRCRG